MSRYHDWIHAEAVRRIRADARLAHHEDLLLEDYPDGDGDGSSWTRHLHWLATAPDEVLYQFLGEALYWRRILERRERTVRQR